ncbi:hypothetical protein QJS04_geneDACA004914 [Acorus gramineus]|uniref:Tubulin--tyrosine ligase-like protein 12 SET-like domain-containing protein n=1 Tax=Acorus gramineus TaxID=55184 RepID=A0AAV9BVB8_ACOGR|nr:hypothetical protein QJS04_geneDACA004914 [Acorus gramineus]
MASAATIDFEGFAKSHAFLLASAGIPPSLHRRLFEKLSSETFDGGHFFSIEPCEGGRQRRLVLSSESLPKESDVFLVDHAWTFRLSAAPKQLKEVPGLAQRMAALMCVDLDTNSLSEEAETEGEQNEEMSKRNVVEIVETQIQKARERGCNAAVWLELDELDIDDSMLCSLDLSTKFPNLVALNLWGNKLQNVETVLQEVRKFKNLRAIWLNENPVLRNCNYTEWALGFCGGVYGIDNPGLLPYEYHSLEGITTLDLSDRCIHGLSTKTFSPSKMPSLSYLNVRGNPLDHCSVDDLLKLIGGFSSLKALEVDIPGPLGNSAVKILESLPGLSLLNGVRSLKILECEKHVIDSSLQPRLPKWTSAESLADRVINAMWLYLMTYRLADEEKIDETSVWYVMDELGSALRHSDEPNFRVAPFLFMPDGKLESAISFSVLWPIQNVHKGDECTRDYLIGIGEDKQRSARLTAWFHTPQNYFIMEYKMHYEKLHSRSFSLPDATVPITQSILPSDGRALRVYTDIPHVEEFLTRPEFVLRDYYLREREGLDNLWILKPWNMARTIDTTVTGDLSAIIRLMETGPKICQKYIEHPALFRGKKFDLRYIVLVRSMDPVEIFLADVYWVRLANNAYSLEKSSFFEYETHFTVMNYVGRLNHMNTPEFVMEFEREHQVNWLDIHQRIREMIRSVFYSAAAVHPEMHSSKSRAIYGVDVMLDCFYKPKILEVSVQVLAFWVVPDVKTDNEEVTYCPDCTRACKYDTEAVVGNRGVIKGTGKGRSC